MIQANELRIGNLVYLYNPDAWEEHINEVCSVVGIDLNITEKEKEIWKDSFGSLILRSKNRKKFNQFSEYAKPIPLTELMLLKCGFKKYSKGIYELVLNSDLDNNLCAFLDEYNNCNRIDYCKGISPMVRFSCSSFHQLQNLYFTLTNNELIITL